MTITIPKNRSAIMALTVGLLALLWAYWTGFVTLAGHWEHEAEYSHGFMVPFLLLVLLWQRMDILGMGRPQQSRAAMALLAVGVIPLFVLPVDVVSRFGVVFAGIALIGAGWLLQPEKFQAEKFQPSWWGLPLLTIGIGLRLFSAHYYIEWFDHLSLIPSVAGIVLLTVGWTAFRWAWPAILFLAFMIPLPHTLEGMLRSPLRRVGTKASTVLMQTVGLPAIADGNRNEILVGGMTQKIGVAEACSGLSMLMIFFALTTAVAVLIRRPYWDKIIVLLSAVPIALAANVLRITVTGCMLYLLNGQTVSLGIGSWVPFEMDGTEFAHSFFHDWAGWMMMPFALMMLWLELWILDRVIVIEEESPMSMAMTMGIPLPAGGSKNTTPKTNTESVTPQVSQGSSTSEIHAPAGTDS